MASRKGAQLTLNLFRNFTSHTVRRRAPVSQLFAGKPGLSSSILVDNTPKVPIFSLPNLLCHSTPKLALTRASVPQQVSGISRLRSSILADNTAKIPIFSSLIHHRLGVYNMNRFLGYGAKRFYCVDRRQVRRFRPPRWFKNPWIMAFVGSGVPITLYFGLETIPYSKRKHLVLMSRAMEGELGGFFFEVVVKEHFKDKILPPDHPYTIQVQSISQNIIQTLQRGSTNEDNRKTGHQFSTSHLEGLNWEVLVVDSDELYACCLPGGKIVVFTELLNDFNSDEEIAFIVGHEVGHGIARHSSEGLTKKMWLLLMGLIICLYIGKKYGLYIGMISAFVYTISATLVNLTSSRRIELEADYIGLLLMASSGYDPQGAIRFSERMAKIEGDYTPNEIFSPHPSEKKRFQSLAQADVMEEALIRYREARGSNGRNSK